MPNLERDVSEWEMHGYAKALGRVFIQRRDLYAKQLKDGRYVCIREWLNDRHLRAHLTGELTLGAYVLDWKSQARYVVLDADDETEWSQLVAMHEKLKSEGALSYLEASRRGGHLWLFFERAVSATEAQVFGRGLLAEHGVDDDIELFPKQARLTSGPGSLIRLPFGVHRRTGRRYGFVRLDGALLAPTIREQIRLLAHPEPVPDAVLRAYQQAGNDVVQPRQSNPSAPRPKPDFEGTELASAPVSERIKAAVSVRAFVERYVELSAAGTGRCPFHNDHHDSFSVNDAENYWHCFACGTGGSIIDYWMQKQDCDFVSAVRELANLLL